MGRSQDALATYLNDHDAGAEAALGMISHLKDQHERSSAFLADLHRKVSEDREVLQRIMGSLDVSGQRTKRVLANLAEKASRLQLSIHTEGETLSLLMGLDTLTTGIAGKLALWQALQALAATEPRLADVDFDALQARARSQLDDVERERRAVAPDALGS